MNGQRFKQLVGFILLFVFIGYMGNKFINNTSDLEDGGLFIALFLVIIGFIVLIINRVLQH